MLEPTKMLLIQNLFINFNIFYAKNSQYDTFFLKLKYTCSKIEKKTGLSVTKCWEEVKTTISYS